MELTQRGQHRDGGHRVEQSPGELQARPVPDRPVPAIGVLDPLVHVGDQPVAEGAAAAVADERPLIGGLLVAQWVGRREDRAELVPEDALAGEPGGERAERAAQQLLRGRRAGPLEHDAAVEEEHAGELEPEPALEVPRHQLGRDRRAHVVGDDEDGLIGGRAPDQLLGEVGLPEEAVIVVPRLRGQPEAEEVEGQQPPAADLVEQVAPVIGAGGEAVQEEEQRPVARPAEGVDLPAPELGRLAQLLPAANPLGQAHRRESRRSAARSRPPRRSIRSRSADFSSPSATRSAIRPPGPARTSLAGSPRPRIR